MGGYKDRLTRLETSLTNDAAGLAWVEVHAAQRRQAARVRLVLGSRLGLETSHPYLTEARAWLGGDDLARRAADEALLAQWGRAHGMAKEPGTARERILQRLNMMARRTEGGGDARRSARDH